MQPLLSTRSDTSSQFSRLLHELDREPDDAGEILDYTHVREWEELLPPLLQHGVLRLLPGDAQTVLCKTCGAVAAVTRNKGLYYRCTDCPDMGVLTEEEVKRYQFNFPALGAWLCHSLGIQGKPEILLARRILRLGKITTRPGTFIVCLVRGAVWESESISYELCKLRSPGDFGILLTLGESSPMSVERTVQVPMAEVFSLNQEQLAVNMGTLEEELWGVYGIISKGRHKERKKAAAKAWLKKKNEDGGIQHGDRDIHRKQMMKIFGLSRDSAQEVWTATVGKGLSKPGRKRKTVRKK